MATGGSQPGNERARAAAELGAERIVRTLRERGHIAYLAGGCVRDLLLGLRPADYDVATDATPDEVLGLFEDAHAVGKAFGVVLVRFGRGLLGEIGGHPSPSVSVEVATFRREGVYSDSRRPDHVEFCGPDEDARRRDFTINALFLDPLADGPVEDRIIDTVGGLDDLRRGVIRAVGDPISRLREDHLRALRAVRFASRLGFAIDDATARAITEQAAHLRGVSEERIGDEIRRMLGDRLPIPSQKRAIGLLEDLGLANAVLGQRGRIEWTVELGPALRHLASNPHFGVVLACWVHDREGLTDIPAPEASKHLQSHAKRIRRALKLSNDEYTVLCGVSQGLAVLESEWASASISRRKRHAATEWFEGSLTLIAGRKPTIHKEIGADVQRLRNDGIGLCPQPWVTGQDLIEAGLVPGPEFKVRLDRAYDAQLDGRARTRTEALAVGLSAIGDG